MSNVNSLQGWKKKRSEMMGEYVAGRNKVNVMPQQYGSRSMNAQRPVSQGQARVAEISRQNRQQQAGLPVLPQTPAEIVGYQQAQRAQASTPQTGGTVLTQEQILANNINDIIKQMNNIMSQPGQMLAPSYSPYYNIFMEQYRENANKAKASAYAQAVAGSGGYGSSYATLAGQQAYRDTMEGFVELTPSLVQTKGQAMSDLMQQYQLAKGLQEEMGTSETATYTLADGTEVEVSEGAREAYSAAVTAGLWTGSNAESVKKTLRNMGYDSADADIAVEMLKAEQAAQVKDSVATILKSVQTAVEMPSAFELAGDSGLEAYAEQLNIYKAAGLISTEVYNEAQRDTSTAIASRLEYLSENIESAYNEIGYDEVSWKEMSDEERKAAVMEYAGELKMADKLSATQYYGLIDRAIFRDVNYILSEEAGFSRTQKVHEVLDIATVLRDYYNSGYIGESALNKLGEALGSAIIEADKRTLVWENNLEKLRKVLEGDE